MPVTRLDPTAEGGRTDWNVEFGGLSKWASVTWPHDDMATTIAMADAGGAQNFMLDPLPAWACAVTRVDSTLRGYIYAGAGHHFKCWYEFWGGAVASCGFAHVDVVWATLTHTNWARPGGGSWLPADFGPTSGVCIEQMVQMNAAGAGDGTRVTTMCTNATWTYASTGTGFLIASWLPPLLAVASHALMKSEIVKILQGLKTRPSDKRDFTQILEAFRVRPKYFFGPGPLAPCRVSHRGNGIVRCLQGPLTSEG